MPGNFMGFQAHIWSGGKLVAEFGYALEDKTMEVCIPSKSGETFEIRYKALSPCHRSQSYSICIYVDGVHHESHYYGTTTGTAEIACKGRRIGPTKIRPFVFGQTDLDVDPSTDDKIDGRGSIELRFCRYESHRRGETSDGFGDVGTGTRKGFDASGSRSMISGSVELGQAESTKALPFIEGRYLDTPDNPYFTIRFVYRTKDLFKSMGLAAPVIPTLTFTKPSSPIAPTSESKPALSRRKRELPTDSDQDSDNLTPGPAAREQGYAANFPNAESDDEYEISRPAKKVWRGLRGDGGAEKEATRRAQGSAKNPGSREERKEEWRDREIRKHLHRDP